MHPSRLIRVAVPVPALDSLTYSLPAAAPIPPSGARVLVPLGSRVLTGCVVDLDEASSGVADGQVKNVIEVLDREPFLPPDVVKLATWVADYYACGIGEAMATAMPPLAAATSPERAAAAFRTVRVAHLSAQGQEPAGVALGPRQRDAIALLHAAPDGIPTSELAERGISGATLNRLVGLNLVTITKRRIDRDPFQPGAADGARPGPLVLTADQESALARLRDLFHSGRFQTAMLHGVTGSGKTEIYLRLAAEVHAAGRGVLILVPEIALTPAVATAFRRTFGERVAIQHSGLSDGERHDQWHRIRRGDVDVVVGTRSAVFAPLQSLGLIVVDEEHDGSYKQEESPRYNARDVAVVRARQANALVVLGSATP